MIFNELSGGVPSVAMALVFPKIPNVIVNTGGNYPWALRRTHRLISLKHKVIMLSSFTEGYATYFDYIRKNDLMPFYVSCCDKAKERHLNKFFNLFPGKKVVNVGFIKGEQDRAERLVKNHGTKTRIFNFPMIKYDRPQCEKILIKNGFKPDKPENAPGERFFKTGCWFCPKQPDPPKWVLDKMVKLINKDPRGLDGR